jgi:hypothetical protein
MVARARRTTFPPNVVWNGWFNASPARICIQALKQDDFASFRDFYFGLLDNKIHTRIEHVSEIKGQI